MVWDFSDTIKTPESGFGVRIWRFCFVVASEICRRLRLRRPRNTSPDAAQFGSTARWAARSRGLVNGAGAAIEGPPSGGSLFRRHRRRRRPRSGSGPLCWVRFRALVFRLLLLRRRLLLARRGRFAAGGGSGRRRPAIASPSPPARAAFVGGSRWSSPVSPSSSTTARALVVASRPCARRLLALFFAFFFLLPRSARRPRPRRGGPQMSVAGNTEPSPGMGDDVVLVARDRVVRDAGKFGLAAARSLSDAPAPLGGRSCFCSGSCPRVLHRPAVVDFIHK